MKKFECLNVKRGFNKNLGKSQRYKAFTLAEVLITLGIIGVVAALTIPTLMANYQKVQYITGLKKAYAEVTEALKLMANENGCPDNLKCVDAFKDTGDWENNEVALGNEFKKYIKVAKDCGMDTSKKCVTDGYAQNYNQPAGNRDNDMNQWGYYRLITADGFSIMLINEGSGCEDDDANGVPNLNLSKVCGQMYIDVNGLKGPNNAGKDIFLFWITTGKGPALYPFGGSENINYAWANSSGTPQSCYEQYTYGEYCAGRIMEQGWQILYTDPKWESGSDD